MNMNEDVLEYTPFRKDVCLIDFCRIWDKDQLCKYCDHNICSSQAYSGGFIFAQKMWDKFIAKIF